MDQCHNKPDKSPHDTTPDQTKQSPAWSLAKKICITLIWVCLLMLIVYFTLIREDDEPYNPYPEWKVKNVNWRWYKGPGQEGVIDPIYL